MATGERVHVGALKAARIGFAEACRNAEQNLARLLKAWREADRRDRGPVMASMGPPVQNDLALALLGWLHDLWWADCPRCDGLCWKECECGCHDMNDAIAPFRPPRGSPPDRPTLDDLRERAKELAAQMGRD